MSRAFIDLQGQDWTTIARPTGPQEIAVPTGHTWSVLELFKVKDGAGPNPSRFIGGTFYHMPSRWTRRWPLARAPFGRHNDPAVLPGRALIEGFDIQSGRRRRLRPQRLALPAAEPQRAGPGLHGQHREAC